MQVAYYQQRYGQGGQQEELPTSVLGKQEELPDSASYTATYISGKQEELPSGKQEELPVSVSGKSTTPHLNSYNTIETSEEETTGDTDKKRMGDTVVPQMSSGGLFEHLVREVGAARDWSYFVQGF